MFAFDTAGAAALPAELKACGCTGVIGVEGVGVAGGSFSELGALVVEFFLEFRFLLSSLAFFFGFGLLVVEGVGGALLEGGEAG